MTAEAIAADGLTVAFGGNVAVDGVSFAAPLASITALIGPNGAGKTTTFNVCSGLLAPKAGAVRLLGDEVTGAPPAERARRGLGRTFQKVQVCETMTVRENVLVACEARAAGGHPWRQLVGRGAAHARLEDDVDAALARCGIDGLAAVPARALSTGQRRLVELARAVAAGYRVLLLDEPSSGLDDAETDAFGRLLVDLVAEQGIGIVLVEHDMNLVLGICERVFVLDFGRLVFEGTAAECRTSEVVRRAYLGADAA